jgi:hypothetical protein
LRDVGSGITGEYKDDGRRYYTTSDLMDAEWAAIERQPTATSGRRGPMAAAKRAGFMAAST